MKNKKLYLFVLLVLCTQLHKSQNFSETAQWISNHSGGKYQISYSQDGYFHVTHVSIIYYESVKEPGQYVYIQSFDPRTVTSVAILKDSKGSFLRLNFLEKGTKVYSRWHDSKTINNTTMFAFDIFLETDYENALRFKKAFLSLFKNLNIKVSDGDYF